MKAGQVLRDLRTRQGLTQDNFAHDTHISKQLVSHIETNRRNMSDDIAKKSTRIYDDAEYGFNIAKEFSSNYIAPLATAEKAIEWHRLALEETFKYEANEAIELFNQISLVKPPQHMGDEEISTINKGIKELLDVQMIINSFLTILEQEYPVSVKDCMNKRKPTWVAKGWIE